MAVLVAWSKVVAFQGLGSGLALIVARLIVGAHGAAVTGVGFLVTWQWRGARTLWSWSRQRRWSSESRGWGGDEWCAIGWCSWARSDICVGGKSHAQER